MNVNQLILQRLESIEKKQDEVILKKLEKLDVLENKMDGLIDTVGEMKVELTEVKDDVSTLKSDVTTLKSDVSTLKSDVKRLDTRVDSLENHVFEIKQILPTFATKDELYKEMGKINDTLEKHTGILNRLDQERFAEKSRADRFEQGLNEVRVHVGLREV